MGTKPQNTSLNRREGEVKGKKRMIQLAQVEDGFFKEPLTMLMLSRYIRMERASICWYVRSLRKANKIAPVKKAKCAITNHWAHYWTTDPALFPQDSQLKLF